jgi:hypothetical protein
LYVRYVAAKRQRALRNGDTNSKEYVKVGEDVKLC